MAITWTVDDDRVFAEAVCGATTESAPTAVTEGLALATLQGVTVTAQAASAFTAGGTLDCYIWNADADTPAWYRASQFDLVLEAVTKQAWAAFHVEVQKGRIAWVPTGSGQNATIYIVGSRLQP